MPSHEVIDTKTVVVKFGGTSLASASQFEKVKAIVEGDPARRFVVASAPGKRSRKNRQTSRFAAASRSRTASSVMSGGKACAVSSIGAGASGFPGVQVIQSLPAR